MSRSLTVNRSMFFQIWKPSMALLGAALVALLALTPQTARSALPADAGTFADLAERLAPAVVNISTSRTIRMPQFDGGGEDGEEESPQGMEDLFRWFQERFGNRMPQQQEQKALGSGFIIDPDGIVITNNHVIEGADEVTVTLSDGTTLEAEIVGRDKNTDLAVLSVKPKTKLPSLKFADSDKARVGDWVIAIGNPFGLGGTVTAGIVSAINRDIDGGLYNDFIQTDAAINRGNSGGPLFNMAGEVLGINSMIYSPGGFGQQPGNVGIGFAIPANTARSVIAELREHGSVKRGWLGVQVQEVNDEIAESLGLEKAMGSLVSKVLEGEPADKAGVMVGDVILQFDDKEIADMRTLLRVLADAKPDSTARVVVWRDGRKKVLRVKVGLREDDVADKDTGGSSPDDKKESETSSAVGMKLAELSDQARESYNIEGDVNGVLVVDVNVRSDAAQKGLRRGDLIVMANGKPVRTPEDVVAAEKEVRKADRNSILLRVYRGGSFTFVPIKLDDKKDDDKDE